jgi:hypothetical protein
VATHGNTDLPNVIVAAVRQNSDIWPHAVLADAAHRKTHASPPLSVNSASSICSASMLSKVTGSPPSALACSATEASSASAL